MIQASIYGCLGADPIERETRNGKAMATASLAVNAGRPDAGEETVWISLAAFGRTGEALLGHAKSDLLGAMGRLYRTRFTARDGQEREGWSLTVDAIVSARTVRPSGGRKRAQHDVARASTAATTENPDSGEQFDDPLPF